MDKTEIKIKPNGDSVVEMVSDPNTIQLKDDHETILFNGYELKSRETWTFLRDNDHPGREIARCIDLGCCSSEAPVANGRY